VDHERNANIQENFQVVLQGNCSCDFCTLFSCVFRQKSSTRKLSETGRKYKRRI